MLELMLSMPPIKTEPTAPKKIFKLRFIRKGKAGPIEDQRNQMEKILAKDRDTRMEGSFGTEKNHYGLRRIMARTEATEKLWIFFGVHTANLCRLIHKIQNNSSLKSYSACFIEQ